jgi:hypothetical protein
MDAKMHNVLFVCLLFLSGCGSWTAPYDLRIENVSNNYIENVQVDWGKGYYKPGFVSPGKGKSIIALQDVIPEKARLFWEDVKGEKNEKEFAIKAVLPKLGKDKRYELLFEIDQEKARFVVNQY